MDEPPAIAELLRRAIADARGAHRLRKWLATVALTLCVCAWLLPLAIPSPDESHSESFHIDLGPTAGLVLGGIVLLYLLALFVVPLVIVTVLAILARRNGSRGRAAAGLLGLLGTLCATLLVVAGVCASFAGTFAIGVLLALGLALMGASVFSRGAESEPTVASHDVIGAPFKRTWPWSAVATGVGAVLVFTGSVRQSRLDARTDARAGGRTAPLSVNLIEPRPARRTMGEHTSPDLLAPRDNLARSRPASALPSKALCEENQAPVRSAPE